MTEQEVKERVLVLIRQDMDGISSENPKVDFKRDWYDLKDKMGINEFIKDTTSIVNTTGLDGLIIIGYNEKKKVLEGAKFSDCKLTDDSHIQNIIIGHCSNIFSVNHYSIEVYGKQLSILVIPPILSKPVLCIKHLRKSKSNLDPLSEPNRIFVRRGTTTAIANKDEIDRMYFEREYLKPEFEYEINIVEVTSVSVVQNTLILNLKIQIENIGRRPLVIISGKAHVEFHDMKDKIRFAGLELDQKDSQRITRPVEILKQSEIGVCTFRYTGILPGYERPVGHSLGNWVMSDPKIDLEFCLSNGNKLVSKNEIRGFY